MAELNGHALALQGLAPAPPKRPMDRRDFLTLLEQSYTKPLANLPRSAWEPVAALGAEFKASLQRIANHDTPEELLHVEETCLIKWDQVKRYLEELVEVSPAVGSLRSNQIVAAMRGADELQNKPSSEITVGGNQGGGTNGKSVGIFGRR